MTDPTEALSDSIAELSTLLLSDESLDSVLQRVVDLARGSVKGCEHAGVTLVRQERPLTAAASDGTTLKADGAQYEFSEGPCLQAIRDNCVIVVDDFTEGSQFPQFGKQAPALGVRSCLSFPLNVHSRTIGALNLYSGQPRAYDEESMYTGQRFAAQAAVALANAQVHDQTVQLVGHLNQALASRAVIEQAKGILMGRQGCSADEAFDILRRASQGRNRKLRDIAEEIVRSVISSGEAASS